MRRGLVCVDSAWRVLGPKRVGLVAEENAYALVGSGLLLVVSAHGPRS